MAASKTEICNIALSNANLEGAVADVDTERSVEAARCRQWYDFTRRAALSAFDWTFARKKVALVAHPIPPEEDNSFFFSNRYSFPLDCLTIREIRPFNINGKQLPHRIEIASDSTRSILTSVDDASMRYTFDQSQTFVFSPMFDMAFSLALGAYIAEPTTGKTNKRQMLLAEANAAIMQAAETDYNNEQIEEETDAPWIQVRSTFQAGAFSFGQNNVFVQAQNLAGATGSSFIPGG